MLNLRTVGVVFLASMAVGVAAQDMGRQGGGRGGPMPGSPVLMTIDANHDGVISAEEIAGASAALKTLDRNGDGTIGGQELMPMGRGREGREGFEGGREGREGGGRAGEPGATPATSADDLVATYMAFDKNKDGKLTKDEVPERMQAIFDRADANKDGALTESEIRASARASAQSASPAGRGEGERGEGREGRGGPEGRGRGPGGMDPLFAALDTNHDGTLQADEIAGAPASLRALDRNKDGRLTADEYRPTGRAA